MAPHPLPSKPTENDGLAALLVPDTLIDTDNSDVDHRKPTPGQKDSNLQERISNGPILFHKVKNQRSILSLIVSDGKIFAGTQGGEILVHIHRDFPKSTPIVNVNFRYGH